MIEKIFDGDNLRMAVGIGTILMAFGIIFGVIATPVAGSVAVGGNETVTLDEPEDDSVEVDLNFTATADATVALEDLNGTQIESQTVSGASGDTLTATLSPGYVSAGDYTLTVTSTDSTAVSVEDSRVVADRAVEVVDAGNEMVVVDVVFQGTENATSTVSVSNDTGTEIVSETISYDTTADKTTFTRNYNDSDGVESGNLTAKILTSPASAHSSAYASVQDSSTEDSIIGGALDGYDSTALVFGALVVLGLLAIGYDRRDW